MPSSILWPTSVGLPAVRRDGYGYALPATVQRTSFPLGARQRRLYADNTAQVAVSWVMTADQAAYLEGWWRNVLQDGVLWFQVPLRMAGTYELREARFVGGQPPQASLAGNVDGLLYSATLELRAGSPMDANSWGVMQAYGGLTGASNVLQALSNCINTDYGF